MGYSKRQFVAAAFEEIGLASYVFDLQPEQLQSALRYRIENILFKTAGMRCLFSQTFQEDTICSNGSPFLNECLDGSQIGAGHNLSIDRNTSFLHKWDGFRYRGRLFI